MRNATQFRFAGFALILIAAGLGEAYATPTTHVWAPSTDTQPFGVPHLTADVYVPVKKTADGARPDAITNTGLTIGLLPSKTLNAEAGFDYKTGYGVLDNAPVYFNGKLAVPENAGALGLPALAAGMYDVGTAADKTNNDLVYAKAAKTLMLQDRNLGRISAGYFWGNKKLLVDADGIQDSHGVLLAWERTMKEIDERLWVCTEYQGTESSYGSLNLGFSWQFSSAVSVLCGYEFYNNRNLADTVTIQLDVNF